MDSLRRTIFILFCTYTLTFVVAEKVFTDEFAVHIRGGRSVADELATKYGYVNKGQIGALKDHYLFQHNRVHKRSVLPSEGEHTFLEREPMVQWMEQQHIKKRVKRDFLEIEKRGIDRVTALQLGLRSLDSKLLENAIKDPNSFSDPRYHEQWYMHRSNAPTMNIEGAWELGYTGHGVVVSILDDGIEYNNPDLSLNYDENASYDYNSNDKNAMPRYDFAGTNRHGTRCAGEVAMQADNGICGVGIAYNASIGGVRMLDGDVTDAVEGKSLSFAREHIDIYSASWGPDDDGMTVDGPGKLAIQAFKDGITEGRGGLGSIYVWASGNGGRYGDSCNCDGYANSIYTMSISSTSEHGGAPWYLETCASTLATTFSSGDKKERKIVTTDLHQRCTSEHTGTSASAPIAAGIVALALEANPDLTWRDVQYLVVKTSRKDKLRANDWIVNGAGYSVSHVYGFGLMDAKAMVEKAKLWQKLPEQRLCEVNVLDTPRVIEGSNILRLTVDTTACESTGNHVRYLEHVQAKITLTFSSRGDMKLRLTSPQNTESTILQPRRGDRRSGGFNDWAFMSTHYWGEEASGTWILEVENTGLISNLGKITQWVLMLYGTETLPQTKSSKRPRSVETDFDPFNDDDSWVNSDFTWDSSSFNDYENCHEQCWYTGCDGPNAEDCFKCKHARDRVTQKCVANCPPGQYPPPYLHEKCKFCNHDCKTCVGPEQWDCTSCKGDKLLLDGECLDECDDGYFADKGDNICHRCDDLCLTCEEAPDNCQECVPGAVMDDNECKLSCPNRYYLYQGECQPCDESCENCHGPEVDDCISCRPDKVHKGQTCVDEEECGNGFYISDETHQGEESRECISCHPTCATCDGFSYDDCLTCPDDAYLNFGVCEPDCQDGTYKSLSDFECHDCPDGCKLCVTETICIKCDSDRVLSGGQCNEGCQTGFYDHEGTCSPCHELCLECIDGGLTDCTECKQDKGKRYLLEGACLPFCPEGYFMDDDSRTCKECDETCRRCDARECLECMDDKVDAEGNWVCGENEHTGECDPKCATCMTDEPGTCLTCASDLYMYNYDCVDTCNDGYYADVNRQSCRLCHPSCKTCDGLHVHDCLSCESPQYVLAPVGKGDHKTCETHCPDGTYEDDSEAGGRLCLNCNANCSTCDGPREEDCISCDGGRFLQVNWLTDVQEPERKCVEACEEGTFGAPDDGECLPCHPSCRKCISEPNHCTACAEGYHEDENDSSACKNSGGCRDNQFRNGDGVCKDCHDTCETCDGRGDTDCVSCDYYRFLTQDSRCLEVCPSDYYPDFDLNVCLPCHETCDGCVMGGPSDCLDCKPEYYSFPYDGQECVTSCPEGFYEDEEDMSCQQCSLECRDCDESYWQCISCDDGNFLFQERCVDACPYEYQEDTESNRCVKDDDDVRFPCPLNCEECDDWGDCQKCEGDFVRYYGECLAKDSQALSLCASNQFHIFNVSTNEVECGPCDSSCATCQGPGADECLSCSPNRHLNRGTCEDGGTSCPDGMYLYETECLACHPSCKTCSGPSPNQCDSCETNLKYDDVHKSCHVSCPSHTFFSEGGCVHCDETCGTCKGPSNNDCHTCENGLYLWGDAVNNKQCKPKCPDGTFHYRPSDESTDNYECQKCHASCEKCFGGNNDECTSCPSNMYRQGFICVTNCEEGYYPDKQKVCQRCHITCESCSGANSAHCLSCAGDLYLQEGRCKEDCDQGWYQEPRGHRCGQCHPRCMTCSDNGIFDCKSCHESYTYENDTCYNRCQQGKYWKNGTCEKCAETCKECFGPKAEHCIDCPSGLLLKRLDVNHSSCVRCCADDEELSEHCCNCNEKHDKCLKTGSSRAKNNNSSPNVHLRTGTVVLGVILAITFFCTVFCVLQARSKKMLCFKDSYDRLPAYYDSKGNHVIMSKQYQHEKINVMSDDEDFYEDLDSDEED